MSHHSASPVLNGATDAESSALLDNGANTRMLLATGNCNRTAADTEVADTEVADAEVADTEVADAEVADTEVADAEVAEEAERDELEVGEAPGSVFPALPPAKGPQRFRFWSIGELFEEPEPRWLIADFLMAGTSSLLTAQHASFKSFLALSMALCVATGRDWYGHPVEAGAVLYIAAEGGDGLRKRVGAWLCHHNVQECPAHFYAYPAAIEFANPDTVQQLSAELAALQPVLIIVDTLARCAVGMDENSARDMGQFIRGLDQVAKSTGAHVMIVHHNNKNGNYRGSTSLPAAVDTHFTLTRKGQDVVFSTEKQKDAPQAEPQAFHIKTVSFAHPHLAGKLNSIVLEPTDREVEVAGYSLKTPERAALLNLVEVFGEDGATAREWESSGKTAGLVDSNHRRTRRVLVDKGAVVLKDKSGTPISAERRATLSPGDRAGLYYFPAPAAKGSGATVHREAPEETLSPVAEDWPGDDED